MKFLKLFFGFVALVLIAAVTHIVNVWADPALAATSDIGSYVRAIIVCAAVLVLIVLFLIIKVNNLTDGKLLSTGKEVCKNCGESIVKGSTFCHKCGTRIDNAGNMTETLQLGYKWYTTLVKGAPWAGAATLVSFGVTARSKVEAWVEENPVLFWIIVVVVALIVINIVLSALLSRESNKADSEKFFKHLKGNLGIQAGTASTLVFTWKGSDGFTVPIDFSDPATIVMLVVVAIAAYLLWYRLNLSYFKKRT